MSKKRNTILDGVVDIYILCWNKQFIIYTGCNKNRREKIVYIFELENENLHNNRWNRIYEDKRFFS